MQMNIPELHPWPRSQSEALKIQHNLKNRIIAAGSLKGVKLIAGVDTAFDHIEDMLFAGVCLYNFPELEEIDRATTSAKALFPYIPGLHAFREGPVMLKALSKLNTRPDLIMFSAHGIAHQRGIGLASHLGLFVDIPSVGCARKRLVGQYEEPGPEAGAASPLLIDNCEVGRVYRTRAKVKPVFISPGYRCDIDEAVEIVVKCLCGNRIPEPIQAAHRLANRMKRNNKNRD
jgi:deoxyribonuclease V